MAATLLLLGVGASAAMAMVVLPGPEPAPVQRPVSLFHVSTQALFGILATVRSTLKACPVVVRKLLPRRGLRKELCEPAVGTDNNVEMGMVKEVSQPGQQVRALAAPRRETADI